MADIAPAIRQLGRESPRLFANPSNLCLVATNGSRLRDLHAPAAVFLLPELGDDSEPDESVVHVLRQAFGCNRKLDSWIAANRVDSSVAAHQNLDEHAKPIAVPAPNGIRETLLTRELAHQFQFF